MESIEIREEVNVAMQKVSSKALEEIRKALDEYHVVCQQQLNTKAARDTYYGYAERFVRWLNDEFDPGRMGRS